MSSSIFPRSVGRKPTTKPNGLSRRPTFEVLESRELLNSDGTVMSITKISHNLGGGPSLNSDDYFGRASTSIADMDGDGINELVVGAPGDDTGGQYRGAAHILFLNSDGTAKSSTKIASGTNGGPSLENFGQFAAGMGSVGDLDGDGVGDLAVGAYAENVGGTDRGAAYVLLLNSNGSVKSSQKLAHGVGGLSLTNSSFFGSSAAGLGDLDGDGVRDIAVGASGDSSDRGAVFVFFMNADGTAKSFTKIGHQLNGGPTLNGGGNFGKSTSSPGDLDGDGVADLAVGQHGANAVHVLFMNTDGTVKSSQRIANGAGGGPPVGDEFGTGVSTLGDMDGDGVNDLAVGARLDDTGGSNRGAVYVLFMNTNGTVREFQKIADGVGGGPSLLDSDFFGRSVTGLGDINGDGALDLAAGADDDDTGGDDRGAAYVMLTTPDPALTVTIAADSVSESAGPAATTATVSRTGATTDAVTVSLTSNDTTEATVQSSVIIAAGAAASPPFNIDAVDDTIVDGTQTVTLTASSTGFVDGLDTVDVTDDDVEATVSATVINGGQVSRSGVASLSLQFNASVTLTGPGALLLHNHTTGAAVSLAGATLTGNGTNAITWDVSSVSLPDGNYTATLPAAVGLAATYTTSFHRLPGDTDGDGAVGFGDFGLLASNFNASGGAPYSPGDMDGNGDVGFTDFGILAANFNRSLPALTLDFGDAPESGTSFPTTLANNGARHVTGSGLLLGPTIDDEADGQPNATATGDGADEDGVTFGTLTVGTTPTITVVATVPGAAVLNAWIDFNGDNDWDDTGEKIFSDQTVTSGNNSLTASIPAGVAPGQRIARFRLSTDAGHTYSGLARDGEVEDYQVSIVAAKSSAGRAGAAPSFDLLAASFVALPQSTQLPSVDQPQPSGGSVGEVFEPTAAEVVDLAIADAAERQQDEARERSSSLDERLVDQVHEAEQDLLSEDLGLGGRL